MAGSAFNPGGLMVGAAWIGGSQVFLPSTPGTTGFGSQWYATSINDARQIVGIKQTDTRAPGVYFSSAVMWDVMQSPSQVAGSHAGANSINGEGTIAGYGNDADGYPHAAVWRAGVATFLPSLAGDAYDDFAKHVNASGQIVGSSNNRAVIWADGGVLDLNTAIPAGAAPPSTSLAYANAINDAGWITAQFQTSVFPMSYYPVILKPIGN